MIHRLLFTVTTRDADGRVSFKVGSSGDLDNGRFPRDETSQFRVMLANDMDAVSCGDVHFEIRRIAIDF